MPPPHQAAPWELLKEIPKTTRNEYVFDESNLSISLGGTQRNGTFWAIPSRLKATEIRIRNLITVPLQESRTFLFAYSLPDAFSRVSSTQPSEEYARASLAPCLMAVPGLMKP